MCLEDYTEHGWMSNGSVQWRETCFPEDALENVLNLQDFDDESGNESEYEDCGI